MKRIPLFIVFAATACAQSWPPYPQTNYVELNTFLQALSLAQQGAGVPITPCPSNPAFYMQTTTPPILWFCTGTVTWTPVNSALTYPPSGVPNSTGTAWGTSYAVGTAANDLVQLNSSGQLPAVSGALLTNLPSFSYPAAGVPCSTGSAWCGSYAVGTGANDLVQLNGSGQLPAVSGALLTGLSSGITQLTGDVTTSFGSGSQPATVKYVNGSLALGADSTVATNLLIGGGGTAVTSGGANSGFGYLSLTPVTTGAYNSAFGVEALYNTTSGSNNTAVGYLAGGGSFGNTTGSNNTYVGSQATAGNSTQYSYQTVIGSFASATCNNCVTLGRVGTDVVYGTASGLTSLPINLTTSGTGGASTYTQATNTLNIPQYAGGSGSMVWPAASGVANYSGGESWGPSYGVGTSANNLVQLDSSGRLPAVNASQLLDLPSFSYPSAGVPNSTGSSWATSYNVGTSANNLVQLNASGQLPAVSGALLTGLPTFTYPGAGVVNSTGSAWGTSYTVGTSANNLLQLNGSAQLPAVSGALLTNLPTTLSGLGGASTYGTVADGSPITWAVGSVTVKNGAVTLNHATSTRALNVTGLVNGGFYTLEILQDSTGGAALTLGSGCTWKVSGGGAGAITLTGTANSVDILTFTYDGTNCRANLQPNFS